MEAYPDPIYRHHVIGIRMKDLEVLKPGEKRPGDIAVTSKGGTANVNTPVKPPGVKLNAGGQIFMERKALACLL